MGDGVEDVAPQVLGGHDDGHDGITGGDEHSGGVKALGNVKGHDARDEKIEAADTKNARIQSILPTALAKQPPESHPLQAEPPSIVSAVPITPEPCHTCSRQQWLSQ